MVHVHALRHSFGTHLSLAGVAPRVAQAAMRHSNISLTMGTYTDARLLDTSEAIEALPIFRNQPTHGANAGGCANTTDTANETPTDPTEETRGNGTTTPPKLAPTLAPTPGQTCQNQSLSVKFATDDMHCQNTKKPSKSLGTTGLLLVGDIGLEPTTSTMSMKHSDQSRPCFCYIFIITDASNVIHCTNNWCSEIAADFYCGSLASDHGRTRLQTAAAPLLIHTRVEDLMSSEELVSYTRVSTDKQGISGLGLDAQKAMVQGLAASRSATVVAEFTEIESGRKCDRIELTKALAFCRQNGYTLVVAKLDRLARNVAFISQLMESGVDFIACDMPAANRLVLHIMAAVAEEEARLISQRTKEALAAAKARGVKLGSAREGWDDSWRGRGRTVADRIPNSLVTQMRQLRKAGNTFQSISELINAQGHRTASGCLWTRGLVHRALSRTEAAC